MTIDKIIKFILSPCFLLTLSGIILLFNFARKNNNFFDVRKIFSDQLEIFKDAKGQIFVFYGVPILLAFGVANYRLIDKDIVGNIVIVLSIIISMLFAMLSVLTGFNKDDKHYKQVLKETFNTVIFESVLCIAALMASFSVLFIGNIETAWVKYCISFTIYYLIFAILLNIFIVIKRIKSLFDNK
ncbi:hypothetical protein ACS3UN_00035 [Oscillospiraceae bacterium LTW-04]|nr:hypothetical protein RBH76_10400 [Oscillospiraceae bacterium MB24-C1]